METLEKKGKGSALLPFLLFIIIYLGAGLYYQAKGVEMAFYQFPSVTAMFIAVLLAFCMGKGSIDEKFAVFAKEMCIRDRCCTVSLTLVPTRFAS